MMAGKRLGLEWEEGGISWTIVSKGTRKKVDSWRRETYRDNKINTVAAFLDLAVERRWGPGFILVVVGMGLLEVIVHGRPPGRHIWAPVAGFGEQLALPSRKGRPEERVSGVRRRG